MMQDFKMTYSKIMTFISIMTSLLVINSCKNESKTEFLRIDNKQESNIYTIIYGFPSEDPQRERDWIFEGIIYPDSCFTIENKNQDYYLTSDEISVIYNINDYSELEIFVFKGQNENYKYYTGEDRDTLYLKKYILEEMIRNPINVKIE